MESEKCSRHDMKKDGLLCLDDGCDERLGCEQCYQEGRRHIGHQIINIHQFMANDQQELERVFGKMYIEMIEMAQNMEQYVKMVDSRMEKYLEEREEEIRTSMEMMINDLRLMTYRWKASKYHQIKIDELKSIVEIQYNIQKMVDNGVHDYQQQQKVKQQLQQYNQINRMQKELETMLDVLRENDDQMFGEIWSIIEKQKQKQNTKGRQCLSINDVRYLQKCDNVVLMRYANEVGLYKKQMMDYQERKEHYKIVIDFEDHNSSLDDKLKMIEMVNQMKVNHKVAKLWISIDKGNMIDKEIMQKMIERYDGLYEINVNDCLDQVDSVHDQIKQLVRQSTLLSFQLVFYGELYENEQGMDLMKQYNVMIGQKQYLDHLNYQHSWIEKSSYSKEGIQCMVDEVNQM